MRFGISLPGPFWVSFGGRKTRKPRRPAVVYVYTRAYRSTGEQMWRQLVKDGLREDYLAFLDARGNNDNG